jgi:hypothetical protein
MAPHHRGSNWSPGEDQRLLDLIELNKSSVFISATLKRPAKTAKARFAYLQRPAKKVDLDTTPISLGKSK